MTGLSKANYETKIAAKNLGFNVDDVFQGLVFTKGDDIFYLPSEILLSGQNSSFLKEYLLDSQDISETSEQEIEDLANLVFDKFSGIEPVNTDRDFLPDTYMKAYTKTDGNRTTLYSFGTPVLRIEDGTAVKLIDDPSSETLKHMEIIADKYGFELSETPVKEFDFDLVMEAKEKVVKENERK